MRVASLLMVGLSALAISACSGPQSSELRAFADQVDRICAVTYNGALAREDRIYATAKVADWPQRKTEALAHENWAQNQANLHRLARSLGSPPARDQLFRRWLANVALRGRLFHEASKAWAFGDTGVTGRIHRRLFLLKLRSDTVGRRFGLRVCTSNGDEADSRAAYLKQVNAVCFKRNAMEDRLARRRRLYPGRITALSINETTDIASVIPGDVGQLGLRRRILQVKGRLDRDAMQRSRKALRTAHPGATFARLSRDLAQHADRAQFRLADLGLRDCGNWGPTPAPSLLGRGASR